MKSQILTIVAILTLSVSVFAQQAFDSEVNVTCGSDDEASEVVTAMVGFPITPSTPKSKISAAIDARGQKLSKLFLDIVTENEQAISISEEDLQLWMKDASCLFHMYMAHPLLDKTEKRKAKYRYMISERLKQNLAKDNDEHRERVMKFMKTNEVIAVLMMALYDKSVYLGPELAL